MYENRKRQSCEQEYKTLWISVLQRQSTTVCHNHIVKEKKHYALPSTYMKILCKIDLCMFAHILTGMTGL